ncbi:MAG: TetR/AcrR family transcriptional regulator [Halobacteriales archaeon]
MEGEGDEIMEATYRALCENGYACLTMQDIADESEKSKATLHYHYDTKQELLLAFLDYLLDEFHERLEGVDADSPADELVEVLTPRDDEVSDGFRTAMLEMKAQSPYDDGIRRRLVKYETELMAYLKDVVERGVEEEVFREGVDAEETAEVLVAVGNGLRTRSVTVGKTDDELRAAVETYVETCLVNGGDG